MSVYQFLLDQGVSPSSFNVYSMSRSELNEMLEAENLAQFETLLREIGEALFDGYFSAQKIVFYLQLLVDSAKIGEMRKKNHGIFEDNPLRDTVLNVFKDLGMHELVNEIETGMPRPSDVPSLSEGKEHYYEVFDRLNESIGSVKNRLIEMQRKTPDNDGIVSLLEKCETCENEIRKLIGIVQNFGTSLQGIG